MNLAFHRREIILSVPAEYRLQQANEGRYAFLLRPLFVAPDHPLPWMISSSSPIQRPQQTRRLLPALLLAQVLALLIAATGVFSEALSHQVTSCPGPVLAGMSSLHWCVSLAKGLQITSFLQDPVSFRIYHLRTFGHGASHMYVKAQHNDKAVTICISSLARVLCS